MKVVATEREDNGNLTFDHIVLLGGEHPEEGTGRIAEALSHGPDWLTTFVMNEAPPGERWVDVNMAHVREPGDSQSDLSEVRRMAVFDRLMQGLREQLGKKVLSLLVVNIHTNLYPGQSAVVAGSATTLTCGVADALGFDRVIMAGFPNVLRYASRGYDVMNILCDVSPDHSLYDNPAGWLESLQKLKEEGVAHLGTLGMFHGVERFSHCMTVSEDVALANDMPIDRRGFDRIAPEHAEALGLVPAIAYYTWTWGAGFQNRGFRGEVVRAL